MKFSTSDLMRWCVMGALLAGTTVSVSRAEDAGVIRITKAKSATPASPIVQTSYDDLVDDASDGVEAVYDSVYGATSQSHAQTRAHFASFGGPVPVSQVSHHGYVEYGDSNCDCPSCQSKRCRFGRHGHGDCPECHGGGCHFGHSRMFYYFKSKFGFLTPTGNGGVGSPFIGKYARVYPQDVNYFDQRDGQVYAAQAYGVPVAVPLAPVVGHAYNYSWGTPSSRLTPISRVAPRY